MQTRRDLDVYRIALHTVMQVDMGQYNDDEDPLSMCVPHSATEHESDHLDAQSRVSSSHDKTSPIFSVGQEPVSHLFTWNFISSPELKSKSLCGRWVE
ncbi:hypothetical protein TNCV_3052471 [Trichonephila clavipes]|nr:hypothetical protein TNCV_3052471 [Trichonephila clavipes]